MYRNKSYGCLTEKIKFNKSSFGLEDGCDVDTKTLAMLKTGACRLTITLIMVAFNRVRGRVTASLSRSRYHTNRS